METYLGFSKNKKILLKSSSGGIFYHISTFVLNQKGVVYGCQMNDKGIATHSRITTTDDLYNILGSKYVESDISNCFSNVLHDLKNNKVVLFCGTPCQVSSIYLFLDGKVPLDKLLLIDFVCHGAPKKEYWENYINVSNKKMNFKKINFRDKTFGWENYCVSYGENKTEARFDPYIQYFLKNYTLSEKCFSCIWKGEKRFSDVTLGDAWGVKSYCKEMFNKYGCSIIVIRKDKLGLLDYLKKGCELKPIKNTIPFIGFNDSYYYSSVKPRDFDLKRKASNNFTIGTFTSMNFKPRLFKKIYSFYACKISSFTKADVGIVTFQGYSNFGCKLQNYALNNLVNSFGFSTANICKISRENLPLLIKTSKFCGIENKKKYLIYKASRQYEKKNIFVSQCGGDVKVKTLLFGSDQIWNPNNRGGLTFYLGNYFSKLPKISYAVSFGVDEIDKILSDYYYNSLIDFKNISVREKTGKDFLHSLTLNCEVDLDPTLLLTQSQWSLATKSFSRIKIPIWATSISLFYGTIPCNFVFSKNNINLNDKTSEYYCINQFDFVKLISSVDTIYTDSFHACVFAILYKKKVVVFYRNGSKSMFGRIGFLFSIFNINEISNGQLIDCSKLDFNKLEILRQKSLFNLESYLKNIF